MADLFPGANSMVQWKGKKIQIQTQMHTDTDPPEIGTVVIKDGQVIKRKATPVGELLKEPNGQKKVNELLQKQHADIVQAIEDKKKERLAQERKIQEALKQQKAQNTASDQQSVNAEEGESGVLKSILAGLFGKKKKG